MWKHEVEQNPWRYDIKLFLSLPISTAEKRQQALFELESGRKQVNLYSHNYMMFQNLSIYMKHLRFHMMNVSTGSYQKQTRPIHH